MHRELLCMCFSTLPATVQNVPSLHLQVSLRMRSSRAPQSLSRLNDDDALIEQLIPGAPGRVVSHVENQQKHKPNTTRHPGTGF